MSTINKQAQEGRNSIHSSIRETNKQINIRNKFIEQGQEQYIGNYRTLQKEIKDVDKRGTSHAYELKFSILLTWQFCNSSMKVKVKSLSHVQLFATPWTVAYQLPLSMGFSRQEYWSGLPFPFPGDLPNPGIEPESSALQADTLPSEPPGKSIVQWNHY